MATRDLIQAELDDLDSEHLDELYDFIRRLARSRKRAGKQGLMSRLRSICIDGPEDLAANHDLYVTGEKRARANSS